MSAKNHDALMEIYGLAPAELTRSDMEATHGPVFKTTDEAVERVRLEVHEHHHAHDHAHVDLLKEEYTPEEVALMLGTSLEVIMHAIWRGELKAKRIGHQIVCISRAALVAWYRSEAAKEKA